LVGTAIFAVLSAAAGAAFTGATRIVTIGGLFLVGIIVVWIAGYMLWKAERENLLRSDLKFQKDRDELQGQIKLTRPKIAGKMLQFSMGEWKGRKIVGGPANAPLGTEVRVFLGLWSISPVETQIIQFRLLLKVKGREYETKGLPIKDGSLERADPFKDLVGFLSNESRKIQNGDYFEGQASFKVEDFFWSIDDYPFPDYTVIVTDSYHQDHMITDHGRWMHTSSKHKQ
jgi:hypothetical protein